MKYRNAIYACLPILMACSTHAAENDKNKPHNFIVQWDNDLLTGTDRDYTNGARVAYVNKLSSNTKSHNFLQKNLRKLSGSDDDGPLADHRFRAQADTQYAWGTGLTQLMFTPEDPNAFTAPNGQRPYAGWLGLELTLHASNLDSANSITLSLGTTGPNSFAQETQEWVHTHISGSPIFQGWDSQIPGEATVNLHFDRKERIRFFNSTTDRFIELDGYYEWGAAVGNFRTDAYLGSLIRLGYNLPSTHTTPRVQLGSSGHNLFDDNNGQTRFSVVTFFGLRGSTVLHDITLDGTVFRNSDTYTSSKPLVGEFIYGLSLRYDWLEFSASRSRRSDEFEGQTRNHNFGSFMLRASTSF